MTMNL